MEVCLETVGNRKHGTYFYALLTLWTDDDCVICYRMFSATARFRQRAELYKGLW